ncbi:binding-protein-dependent transport systems inner membrane component [Desulfofarcimen acetoxidans DSM 771]|uniref:Binding-protein-dependent transport systems inner membrane component n=1 Tax=Desulfofarcimen acetoxidans (strain ATCC 49208 / DSM 771 / KCTC 5769 / VKM B-1644 / 5575) TaxID=485916 RepID=C8W527_DESAS|nr:nickel transporter permease [Desulfofarcimen acetoxidans]ACV61379.1 binding-protein-dependent transport systems inner membrane component [Desulfofarcimen acetoxidans DSM 771]
MKELVTVFTNCKETLKSNRMLSSSATVVVFIFLLALAGQWIMPHDPAAVSLADKVQPPSFKYPFGTDSLGRCIFSRVIEGTHTSLSTAAIVVAISGISGVLIGLISGYFGGILDSLIMRTVDVMLAFPGIILSLALIAAIGPGLSSIIIALTMVHWTGYTRLIRGEVLSVKQSEFVEAARAMGNSQISIMFKYILPSIVTPVIVMAALDIAHVVLAGASLSFLGLGAQPPTAEWGAMINEGREFIRTAPHITLFPGLAVMITVLAFNMLGDSLRDVLDPRLREGQIE